MSRTPQFTVTDAFGADRQSGDQQRLLRLWIAFVLLAAGLFAQQFVTLGKFKQLVLSLAPDDPVNVLGGKVGQLAITSWRTFVTPADLTITAVIVLTIGYVVWSEWSQGTFTALLDRADRSSGIRFAFLGLATLVAARCYLTPGQVFMGDSETHLLRSWMYAENIRHFQTPVWTNAWYGGIPLLSNYGPLYFIVTALLTIVFGDIHLATKLLLWSCHLLSVWVMFAYLRETTRRNLPALVGAFAYAISFLRLHILLYQGDLQLSLVFALYPAILLLVERYLRIRSNARSTFVLMTLALSVLILNHHGYGFFGLVLLAIYLVARLAVTADSLWQRFKILVLFGCAEVTALLITAFLWLPFLVSMGEHRGMNDSAFPILIPNPRGPIMLVKLFKWTMVGDGSSLGYIGLSIGVLAVIAIVAEWKNRTPAAVGLMACSLSSLLMARNYRSYNTKNVDFFLIFLCALTAWAVVRLIDSPTRVALIERSRLRWANRFPAHVAAVCIAVMTLDLGLTTFQSVFRENYQFKQPMYQKVLALDGPYKLIERQVLSYDPNQMPRATFDPNKLGIPSAYAATQTPLGFFHEGAGLSFGYNAEIVKNLHRDLNVGTFSKQSVEGLYLLGVKYIIFRDRYRWYTPRLPASPDYAIDDGILRLTHATPMVVSQRTIGVADVPGYPATDLIRDRRYREPETFDYSGTYFHQLVEPLLGTMRVDLAHATADTLITRDGELRETLTAASPLQFGVLNFTTDLKHVTVRYRLNGDAFGELPFNYFPYLDVTIDGQPTPFYRSAMNKVIVRAPAGEHVVAIHGVAPPLQAQLLWLGLGVSLLTVAVPRRVFASVNS